MRRKTHDGSFAASSEMSIRGWDFVIYFDGFDAQMFDEKLFADFERMIFQNCAIFIGKAKRLPIIPKISTSPS